MVLAAALASKLPPESTDKEASMPELDPSHIMQVGMGFFASKTLLSAVELGLFTELAKQPMTGAEIVRTLGLNHRAVPDFPDALVALRFLGAFLRFLSIPSHSSRPASTCLADKKVLR